MVITNRPPGSTFLGYLYLQPSGHLLLLDGDGNKVSEILELSRADTAAGVLTVNLKLPSILLTTETN